MTKPNDREHLPDLEDALRAVFQTPAPTEAFVDRLEQQLLTQSATPTAREQRSRRPMMFWQRSRQLVSGAIALLALLVLVVEMMALFSNFHQVTTTSGTPTPSGPLLTLNGSITEARGPIGSRQLPVSVRAALPQLPDRVPLYDIRTAFDQPSAELARSWAEKLGLTAVRLYQDTTVPEATYIAQSDDGRSVRVGPGAQLMYQANADSLLVPSRSLTAPDLQAAQAAAVAFLNSIPDLIFIEGSPAAKITFRVEPSPHQAPETHASGMTFEYTALIDGLPVLSRGTPSVITVDAGGWIRSAILTPLHITPTGQEVAVQPADTVVHAFLNDDQSVLRGSGWSSALTEPAAQTQAIHTRAPSYTVGDNVTLKGGIQHWIAVDGGADLYVLSAIGTQSFILEGDGLNVSSTGVEIKGRIAGQVRSSAWRISVVSIQPIAAGPQAYADWTGILHRQADGTWLETDGGQIYLLPDPPADLPDGVRVEAPGAVIDNGNGALRLEWQIIYIASQSAAGGSVVSGSVSSVQRQVVGAEPATAAPIEPTQVITAAEGSGGSMSAITAPSIYPNGAPYASGIFQSVTSSAGESIITPTLPAWWTYKPGDDVTVEGEFSAQGYRIPAASPSDPSATPAPGQTVFEAHLLVMKDEDRPDEMVPITLVGDQVNLDLIRLGGLHVRVQGRLLSSDDAVKRYSDLINKGLTGFALEVTHYERAQPAETKGVYSGRIRVEILDGKEVAIFSDTLSGQEYVLADSLTMTYTLEMYRQQAQDDLKVQAIGVVAANKTFASRPVLRLLETRSSTSNSDEALQALRAELDNPIQDIGPAPDAPQDVIIDRVELAYVFQMPPERAPEGFTASPTQLVYELTGHSSDGRFTVTYDLEATAPTPPDAQTIEPPLAPPSIPAPTEPTSESATPTLTSTPSPPTPAPTATDGPPPTLEPTVLEVIRPITDRQIAIQLAIEIDRTTAQRDQPITEAMLAANPDMVTAERFANQAESGFGVATAYAAEPVWIVTFKGKGTFNLVGMNQRGPFEGDSVSYEFLEKTGTLLGLAVHPVK